MDLWCSIDDVSARVQGDPSNELCTQYAEIATDVLYVASGRRFAGESTITTSVEVDKRGYCDLTVWQPVRNAIAVRYQAQPIEFGLSPAGVYIIVERRLAGEILDCDIEIGSKPPRMGKHACAALAAELLRGDPRYATLVADTSDDANDVKDSFRLTQVTRQGVTYSFADPIALMEADQTGIYEVDLFIKAVNPGKARYQPKVVSV